MTRHAVTVIPGDGIGPECVHAAIDVVNATGVGIDWIEQHAGERVFKQGIASGVPQDTIDSISQTRVVLKGPLGTPVGFGEKSANVTLRIHQRVKLVDRLESARIQNDDCHLDDPVMATESRGFRIDDCVVRHGSLVHPGNRPRLAVYADLIGSISICNIRRHSP
jgi:isocitrate/isopropylmalate dehydrogenase